MLKGQNIYLRTIEPSDAQLMLKWENNSENWAVSNTLVPFSEHLILQYVNSAQDIFEIMHPSGKEVMVPVLGNFIQEIDRENKILKLEAPEGLIAFYLE